MYYLINHNAEPSVIGLFATPDHAAMRAFELHGNVPNDDVLEVISPSEILQALQSGKNSSMDNWEIVEEANYRYLTENNE